MEKVITVTTDTMLENQSKDQAMDELRALVEADGGEVVGEASQRNLDIRPRTFIGSGKVEEIKEAVENLKADAVVFGDPLSGIQQRNLEEILNVKVVDRTRLILDIFGLRAKTGIAKDQVRLAQLEYEKTRLAGSYDLSRTGGGIGTRGPGEQKLEVDRRHLRQEISRVKQRLAEREKQYETSRKERENSSIPIVSLAGYTNAGKSSLMNLFLRHEKKEEVLEKDMLFATLDTTLRKVDLPGYGDILLGDTVGFISRLPHQLVQAFRSTLEEVRRSDLILHVLDGSDPQGDLHRKTTEGILKELDADRVDRIIVVNKIDKVAKEDIFLSTTTHDVVFVSVKTEEGIDELYEKMEEHLGRKRKSLSLSFTYDRQKEAFLLKEKYPETEMNFTENGVTVTGKFLPRDIPEGIVCTEQ